MAFMQTLNDKLRAHDAYGVWKKLDNDTIISRHFVMTKEDKKKIDVYGKMPPEVIAKIRLFYEAVAQNVEMQTGKMANAAIDINTEGFGRAMVIYDDTILVQSYLRNAHKYGFADLEKVSEEGESLTAKCLAKLETIKE